MWATLDMMLSRPREIEEDEEGYYMLRGAESEWDWRGEAAQKLLIQALERGILAADSRGGGMRELQVRQARGDVLQGGRREGIGGLGRWDNIKRKGGKIRQIK